MTGYQEVLTDPSYARQIVTLTYPHVGNTGMTDEDDEADRVWSAGLIVRDVPPRPSSWRSRIALPQWLQARGVVGIAGIDTRRLTRLLRERRSEEHTSEPASPTPLRAPLPSRRSSDLPHVGNTGMTDEDDEADRVWSAGLIVRDVPPRPSSWRSRIALPQWLQARGVVGIAGIDTRRLTRLLRER